MNHRTTVRRLLPLMLALPLVAVAAEAPQPVGEESKAWLQLQNSGQQAANGPRPMPGEMADHVYQRYLDSFKQPIPAEFKRQSTSDSANGSGQ